MIEPHYASPCELFWLKLHRFFRSRGTIVAACLFFCLCFASETTASQTSPPETTPAQSTGTKENSNTPAKKKKSKKKTKAKAKKSTKAKSTSSSRRSSKIKTKPKISAQTKAKAEAIVSEISCDLPKNFEQEISKLFGLRYRRGGEGVNGIDCSGLVNKVYSKVFGINLPRNSSEISTLSIMEDISGDELKIGDLVFFGPRRKRVNHVGIYLSSGHFLHASSSQGVTISRMDDSYWQSRYMFSKRVPGLDIGEETGEKLDLQREVAQDSARFAYAGRDSTLVNVMGGGIALNDSLELTANGFFLNRLLETGPTAEDPFSNAVDGFESDRIESGVRLAASLSPLQWLTLVPSVTRFDAGKDEKGRDIEYQKIGMETWNVIPYTNLSVFMAAHANNQQDLFHRPTAVSPDWETLDIAIGLHYKISESLNFAFWGTRAYSSNQDVVEKSTQDDLSVDDVFFQFNLRF